MNIARRLASSLAVSALLASGCGGADVPDPDPDVVAACKSACEQFIGGACYGACTAGCGTCTIGGSVSNYDHVRALDCSSGKTLNIFFDDSSVACTLDAVPDDNGTGTQKRVFITKSIFSADLASQGGGATGLQGADNLCNQAAQAAELGGTWGAWLSDSTHDAIDRVSDVGPWLNVSRTAIVFPNKASLTQQPDSGAWWFTDEHGNMTTADYVWTGTSTGGRVATFSDKPATCADWTEKRENLYGWVGATGSDSGSWTDAIPDFCARGVYPIYCVEQ